MTQARLLKPRDKVREMLSTQIDEARNIAPSPIRSTGELAAAEAREKQWRDYNDELLRQSFSTSDYPHEYDRSQTPVHIVDDRYFDPSLEDLAARLSKSVKGQVACLESIIQRLELIRDTDDAAAAQATSDTTRGHADLVRLAERLHRVVRQLCKRHGNRATLTVNDEYDVQDLVHSLLTIFFDDIRPEEWTPSYAGGASRIDFLLPEIETVVEIKKTRPSLSTRELGDQLIVDIEKYKRHPDCRNIFCLVYDPDEIIKNPRGVENDLDGPTGKITVRVLIVPKR